MFKNQKTAEHFDQLAPQRAHWKKKNAYYYSDVTKFAQFHIPQNSKVLEIGCGTGDLLASLKPNPGVGIDISSKMLELAKTKYPQHQFLLMDAEALQFTSGEKFDYVILTDLFGHLDDVQNALEQLKLVCHEETRIIITYINYLWEPLGKIAETLGLKMRQNKQNWLNVQDLDNLIAISGLDTIKYGRRFLAFWYVPLISNFINRYLAPLPILKHFCLYGYHVARLKPQPKELSVSVIIPARNEAGNIEAAILRTPKMGTWTELVFVEGNSTDNTWDVIQKMSEKYKATHRLKITQQPGKGKGDACRKGYSIATGDIFMILDADLTVPPEDLTKFYNAIASGNGEYINGSRLVYTMESKAMRPLNFLGNKFFSIAFSWLLDTTLKDTLCGTKVLTRKNYFKIAANRAYFGEFDPFGDFDLLFGAWKQDLKFVEIPIRYRDRQYGETNISRFKHGWILLKMVAFALHKIKFV